MVVVPWPSPQLILCREYTRAEEKDWHLHHFTCIACDTSLGGQRYVVHDENTYCLHCNDKYFAKTCEVRNEGICKVLK